MNPKERVLSALSFRAPDRVPYSFSFTQQVKRNLQAHFGAADVDLAVGNHIISLTINPGHGYHPLDYQGDSYVDEWGVVWGGDLKRDRGYPVVHPLASPSLTGFKVPDPADPRRFSHLRPARAAYPDRFLMASLGVGGLWERGFFLRGYEELLVDLHENPGFAAELLDVLASYYVDTIHILAQEYGDCIDAVSIPDDYGTQRDLLVSPADWRRFFKPRLARVFEAVRGHGYPAFLHADGNITKILPDLVEIGLNVLHPVQPEAMDVYAVKKEYYGRLVIYGGICTQTILPSGTPEEVRREVREKIDRLGQGGGYIASCISLQHDVPPENLLALFDEAKRG